MTKKHFIALADVLRNLSTSDDGSSVEYMGLVDELAVFCAQQNPRFNRERWINYITGQCGPNGGAR